MIIRIDNRDPSPIYDQVCRQLEKQILEGVLQADDPLPSIRALAKDLRISVVTTKRAYEELERAGRIYAVAAKGFFVAPLDREQVRAQALEKITRHLKEASQLARSAGIEPEEVQSLLRKTMEG